MFNMSTPFCLGKLFNAEETVSCVKSQRSFSGARLFDYAYKTDNCYDKNT